MTTTLSLPRRAASQPPSAPAAATQPTPFGLPFDLRITEWRWQVQWPQPLSTAFPGLALSRLLRARLWRSTCVRGSPACAEIAQQRESARCRQPQACLAHALMPLPGISGEASHVVAELSAAMWPEGRDRHEVVVRVRGDDAPRAERAVHDAVAAIVAEGLGDPACRQTGQLVEGAPRHYSVAERAAALAGAQWEVELVTPWVVARDQPVNVATFAADFASHAGQRAYKLAALYLTQRQRAGVQVPTGAQANKLCVAARDAARADLSALECGRVALSRLERSAVSSSNAQSFGLGAVVGTLRFECALPDERARCASWLAMLEVMGGGALTAEGFGAVRVRMLN